MSFIYFAYQRAFNPKPPPYLCTNHGNFAQNLNILFLA